METVMVPYGLVEPLPLKVPFLSPFLTCSVGSVVFLPADAPAAGFLDDCLGAGVLLPARSAGGGAAGAAGGCTLRRTPTMRAAPVRVPTAAAVLRRIAR